MEEVLTLEELIALHAAINRQEHRRNKFAAALKGVDIDEGQKDEAFEKVKLRAEAELLGKSEQEYVFDTIGIEIESDDD